MYFHWNNIDFKHSRSIGVKDVKGERIMGFMFNNTLMDLSIPKEYAEAETLTGVIYKANSDLNNINYVKQIKEMNEYVGIVMFDKVLKQEWVLKLRKDQLATLKKFRKGY